MRGRIEVEFVSRHECMVRGYGSRALLERITGRAPVYRPLQRAWSCQEPTARACVALAEAEGCDVLVSGPRGAPARVADATPDQTPESAPSDEAGADPGHQMELPW